MRFEKTYIPYGAYWSTPFCKWQGSFAPLHPIRFAAEVATRALAERGISPEAFAALHLGNTVPAPSSFYGAPWLAGLLGAEGSIIRVTVIPMAVYTALFAGIGMVLA